MFTPTRLALARKRRGLTKKAVAEKVGVTARAVVGFESGALAPGPMTVVHLAELLRFPVEFFEGDDLEEIPSEAASFRSLRSMSAAQRHAALSAGRLAFALQDWISERFRLPEPSIPQLVAGIRPEMAAQVVRTEWGLGQQPIPNLIHLLEAHGVRVFSLAEECREIDGYSLWRSGQPYIFLNTQKTAEHSRFDAAHELGHLVLHWHHQGPRGEEAEREAHRFAAAFLLPAESITATALRNPTLAQLIQAKRHWRVSLAAFAHRLHELRALSDWQYRTLCIEIARRGYRTDEPNGIPRETSQILNKVFTALRKEGVTKADVARALRLHTPDLDALVFGLAMLPAPPPTPGSGSYPTAPARPRELRLVES